VRGAAGPTSFLTKRDTEFLCALRHGIGHHPVHTDRGQCKRQHRTRQIGTYSIVRRFDNSFPGEGNNTN
jgi:hypothetical protein